MSDILVQRQSVQAGTRTMRAPRHIRSSQWRTNLVGLSFVAPFLIIYAIFLIWPVILGLAMSFYNWTLAGAATFLGLRNYQELFGDADFWISLRNTATFTIISTPVLVLLALVLALLANRAIPARWLFRLVFFAPVALPVTVAVIIWNWMYQPGFGLINNMLASLHLSQPDWLNDPKVAMISVVILTVWWTLGNNFLLYLAGLQQIPRDLYEAASTDGAGSWAKFRWVTIPQLSRITTLILILQVIASLQVFGQIYLLTSGGPNFSTRPVIQYIYETGFSSFRMGYASAGSYVLFVLIL
ncbi:MAG: sugar ABC transporter permease, partial [Ktedonobacteraceae bacterium]|nr:sugar ABC transporter permease [Ktedonobacteraceae bacterium]